MSTDDLTADQSPEPGTAQPETPEPETPEAPGTESAETESPETGDAAAEVPDPASPPAEADPTAAEAPDEDGGEEESASFDAEGEVVDEQGSAAESDDLPYVSAEEQEPLQRAQDSIDDARAAATDAVVAESSRGDTDLPDGDETVPHVESADEEV